MKTPARFLSVPLCAAILSAFLPAISASGKEFTSTELNERTLQRRAVEATIWGMPAVSLAAMRESLKRDLDANFGDIVYFSQVAEPRHELLTANNQTPYVLTVLDLRQGAMVLEVPPASAKTVFFGSAVDSWQVPLADLGGAGDDAGKGGKYLFLPPGYTGQPPAGYFVVPSATAFIHVALRPISVHGGTLAEAVAYSQLLKTYALADATRPPANRYVDAYPRVWKTLPVFDGSYLRLLAEVIEAEPPQPKDAAMLGLLASIGLEKDKPFHPDPARAQLLTAAVHEAEACMRDDFLNLVFVPFWPDRQWAVIKPDNTFGYSYYGEGKLDYVGRAAGFAYWATFMPKRLSDPGKLPASYYLNSFRDRSGALLRGDRLYRLRIPADTPVKDFWAIVAYEVGTNAFIHNPENRVGLSSYDKAKMTANPDGSFDVYIGPKAPTGLENNWIPTAGKDFWLIARFYGPEQILFDKKWEMPDVEEVK
ncbi:MAG: DUF1214 domain-containing protein [Lacunisphaera sp.]